MTTGSPGCRFSSILIPRKVWARQEQPKCRGASRGRQQRELWSPFLFPLCRALLLGPHAPQLAHLTASWAPTVHLSPLAPLCTLECLLLAHWGHSRIPPVLSSLGSTVQKTFLFSHSSRLRSSFHVPPLERKDLSSGEHLPSAGTLLVLYIHSPIQPSSTSSLGPL